jgi:5-methylcytosine-specific restriction endonuclease McrA
MCGIEWGRLYELYHNKPYNPKEVSKQVKTLYSDSYVKNRRGVFEFILGGSTDFKLLDVRVFDEATKKSVFTKQTSDAETKSISNCPLCAHGHNANKTKMWKLSEMDADHVTAWSKGGATDLKNCEMLCKTHNRSKGNK